MRIHRKLAIAAGAGVAGLGLFGMVAFAAFAPDTGGGTRAFVAPTGAQSAVEKPKPQDKLKDLLDGLVAKGVITQTQETTILAAVNDRSPRAKVEAVLRDFLSTSAQYLGLSPKELQAKLPGTSLAAIADGTNGKNRAGLVAALSLAGNAQIDQAASDKKLTADQTKTLKDKVAAEIATFVDRKMTPRTGGGTTKPAPQSPAPASPAPKEDR